MVGTRDGEDGQEQLLVHQRKEIHAVGTCCNMLHMHSEQRNVSAAWMVSLRNGFECDITCDRR